MDKLNTATKSQESDDPEATGKSAGVRSHLGNKNTDAHIHTSVRTILILSTNLVLQRLEQEDDFSSWKGSVTFRSNHVADDVRLDQNSKGTDRRGNILG